MFNILDLARRNRLNGLFNPIQSTGEEFQNPTNAFDDNSQPPELSNIMQGKFQQLLSQFPQREHVGKLRQLGAIIAGAGSDNPMQTADQFANYNYYNKLRDYSAKLPFFQRASENENNINRQVIASWIADRKDEQANKRIEQSDIRQSDLVRHQLEQEKQGRDKLDISSRLASVKEWQARNPTYQFKTGRDGYIYAVNPKNPNEEPINTKLLNGDVDDMTKHLWDVDEVRTKHQNTMEEIDKRIQGQKDVKAIPSATKPSSTSLRPTEGDKKRTFAENAMKFKQMYSDWAHYVDDTGKVIPDKNLDATNIDKIQKIIKGELPIDSYKKAEKFPENKVTLRSEIPGIPGAVAESTDGGKTWHRVK